MTITRQQFIDAVEAGIEKAGVALSDAEQALLRHVARTESQTTYGCFQANYEGKTCFCPLSASGITDGTGTDGKYDPFFFGYDLHMRSLIRRGDDGLIHGGGGLIHNVVG